MQRPPICKAHITDGKYEKEDGPNVAAHNTRTVLQEQNFCDKIKYLDVGPQAQLPPPFAEDISALLTIVSS